MTTIAVPYHLDEHIPDLDVMLRPDQIVTVELPESAGAWDRLAPLYAAVAEATSSAAPGACPVIVCGDCCTALGIVAGLQAARGDVGIVWFDAHGDVQTPETTASGYLGGMPLRLLAGYRPELIAASLGLRPVPEDHILLVGARDLDPPEAVYLAGSAIKRKDTSPTVAADLPGVPDVPLYVHVDLDVLDPGEAPGLRFPAPGGPTAEQLAGSLRAILATGRVAAVGIACSWRAGYTHEARLGRLLEGALNG
ncbi:MAG: arginase family protein [Nocardiopsaceae bacterium]|jgi:arginase|nr:arginase family protein [Nocardiopsaceae bacterium]